MTRAWWPRSRRCSRTRRTEFVTPVTWGRKLSATIATRTFLMLLPARLNLVPVGRRSPDAEVNTADRMSRGLRSTTGEPPARFLSVDSLYAIAFRHDAPGDEAGAPGHRRRLRLLHGIAIRTAHLWDPAPAQGSDPVGPYRCRALVLASPTDRGDPEPPCPMRTC